MTPTPLPPSAPTPTCRHPNAVKHGEERALPHGWREQDYRCPDCGNVTPLRFRRFGR